MFCVNKDCLDFLETGFHAEFVDGVTKCPRCGEYLAISVPATDECENGSESSSPQTPMPSCKDPFEPVFETDDPGEITAVEELLRSHGIPSQTRVKDLVDPLGTSRSPRVRPIGEPVVFLVPRSMLNRAWDLLAEFDDQS